MSEDVCIFKCNFQLSMDWNGTALQSCKAADLVSCADVLFQNLGGIISSMQRLCEFSFFRQSQNALLQIIYSGENKYLIH